MAFLDKLNEVAKNIGEKTNDAIEATKLTAKINSENNAAGEDLKKIGQHYYDLFAASGKADPEVAELCQSAKAHYDAVAAAQNDIEKIKADNTAEAQPAAPDAATKVCPGCGAVVAEGVAFCPKCGQKMED